MATCASAGSSSTSSWPRCDRLRVIDMQRDHRARHLAGDLHEVATDVGIVGALEVAADQQPVDGHSMPPPTSATTVSISEAAACGR